MGYLHITNLYQDQRIQQFKTVFCLEKIHGTSAHVKWTGNEVKFFAGGAKRETFVALFDKDELLGKFKERFEDRAVTFYGEAYGGKLQGMKETYGASMKFVVFDIKVGGEPPRWLAVPQATELAKEIGFEFVAWSQSDSSTETLNELRDRPSVQAQRNGCGDSKIREGIVIRPPFEVTLNNGERLIAKHKSDAFKETRTKRVVGEDLKVMENAGAVAAEWVTPMRLEHVLDKLPEANDLKHTGLVIRAMLEDVLREGKDEIVDSKYVRKAIQRATVKLWKLKVCHID